MNACYVCNYTNFLSDVHVVVQFSLGKNLNVVTGKEKDNIAMRFIFMIFTFFFGIEFGEVYGGAMATEGPVCLERLPQLQNSTAVFTDYKANNYVCLQSTYRYACTHM